MRLWYSPAYRAGLTSARDKPKARAWIIPAARMHAVRKIPLPTSAGLQPVKFKLSRLPEGPMEFEGFGEIIASRMLYLIDEQGAKRPVSVFVGKPQPSNRDPGYECPFQIIGIGSQNTLVGRGCDSIEALKTALTLLGSKLHELNEELGGGLVWEGGSPGELGFP